MAHSFTDQSTRLFDSRPRSWPIAKIDCNVAFSESSAVSASDRLALTATPTVVPDGKRAKDYVAVLGDGGATVVAQHDNHEEPFHIAPKIRT
jgi:hypothetical protein